MLRLVSPKHFHGSRRGQSMTEYVIIVGLIAIFCIGIFTLFGNQIRDTTSSIINKLSGKQDIHNKVTQEDTSPEDNINNNKTRMSNF